MGESQDFEVVHSRAGALAGGLLQATVALGLGVLWVLLFLPTGKGLWLKDPARKTRRKDTKPGAVRAGPSTAPQGS